MSDGQGETRMGNRRPWLWAAGAVAALGLLIPLGLLALLWSGWADGWMQRAVAGQIAKVTGGRVELGRMRLDALHLRVVLEDLTVHGREPAGTPPFFHAERLDVAAGIDNFWPRRISLRNLELIGPSIHVRFEKDGSNNAPAPRPSTEGATPLRQRLFSFLIRRVRIVDGELLINDVRIPLVAQGGRLEFGLDYSETEHTPAYFGELKWREFQIAVRRYLPFGNDLSVRFEARPNSFSVTQLVWTLPHSSIDAQFGVPSFAEPYWAFRYRGKLGLEDIRTLMRKPSTPDGRVEFAGRGRYSGGKLALDGDYDAQDIALHFQWFHAGGIGSRGSYHADSKQLTVPDFSATAFGGSLGGRVGLVFDGLRFRTETRASGFRLSSVLAAVDNPSFPVNPLHWAGSMDIDAVTTWNADFKDLDARGTTYWGPPNELGRGEIPVSARLEYHYSMASNSVSIGASEITTPASRVQMSGTLGRNSAIDVTFETEDLVPWDDFINRLRDQKGKPKLIAGKARWQGRISGPLSGPTFAGHVRAEQARYEALYWDSLEGDMIYEPDLFRFERGNARRGPSSAQFELSLFLQDWHFNPEASWSFEATLVRTDSEGLQAVLGWDYPVHGLISGTFRGGGTRSAPQMQGLFDILEPQAWNWRFDRARGEIAVSREQVRINNAELRLLPPPARGGAQTPPAGLLTGNFLLRTGEREASFDLTGAALPMEGIQRIQSPSLPVGGRLSFQLRGEGPLAAPRVQGSLRLVDLRIADDVLGSFQGRLESDGRRMKLDVDSEISTGQLHGHAEAALSGAYPVTAQVRLEKIDLDPLLTAGLRLKARTGHSSMDGEVKLSGNLREPESLVWDANLSRVAVSYASVSLESSGAVRLQYSRDQIRIEQANLRGAESDFRVRGTARFTGDQALGLEVAGQVNLRLMEALDPKLDTQGPARVDASIGGTLANPRITGRVRLEDSSVRYGDFPAGLSRLKGDLVFDSSRLIFDNLTAETGGGSIAMDGAITYMNSAVRFDVTARSDRVRIRYPAGMSWLAGGTLRLTGNAEAATLSGRVTVERLLMAEGLDLGSLMAASVEPLSAPGTTSNFLRNLQFDIQADLAPNARLEWTSARFQTEASMRVRGTWEHPILLGHLHLLNGEMQFRGNRYQLSRGDVNFANPFRLDPVINIEAVTTIRQYEVTVNFTGPASHLTMSYRSDPPLPSSDIIALLALGQTGQETALRGSPTTQTTPSGATTLLSEAISSQLGGRIQRLFGISHFSVDPFLTNTTAGSGTTARVTISQQISRDLIITYVTNITSTQQQIIQIEYAVRRDVSIVALRDENGTFGVDVVFKKRLK